MEAKELRESEFRIGNLLQDRDGRLCRVETLGGDYNVYAPAIKGGLTALPISPIQLTEEWLVKLGFKKIGEWYTFNSFSMPAPLNISLVHKQSTIGNNEEYSTEYHLSHDLLFVHRVQNIIYALSGEELVIK